MEIAKKMKKYIKDNKWYVLSMLIGLIAYAIQIKFVTLYADDLQLGVIAKNEGVIGAFKHLRENYLNWGGGPTPFIAIVFLMFDMKIWKLFNCVIMFLIVRMSVKIINGKSKIDKGILSTIIWSLIFTLNIETARETIYWLDGHLAYVFTFFQLLLYLYYMYVKFVRKEEIKKIDYLLLPMIAFFSGWTGPQPAVLTVVFGVLFMAWKKWIKKETLPMLLKVTFIFSLIGCLVEVLAPGNRIRMAESFPMFASFNVIEKAIYRLSSVYDTFFNIHHYGIGSLAFFAFISFGLIAVVAYQIANKESDIKLKRIVKASAVCIIGFIIFVLFVRQNLLPQGLTKVLDFKFLITEGFHIGMLIPYAISTIIIIVAVLLAFYISMKKENGVLFIIYLLAVVGQWMMLESPYSPWRTTFFSIALLWIAIGYLLQLAYEEKIKITLSVILVLGIVVPKLAMILVVIYFIISIIKQKRYNEVIMIMSILVLGAIGNWFVVTKNYSINAQIYYQNVARIQKFIEETPNAKELILLRPNDIKYGWEKMVGVDWIEKATKEYFGINENVKLKEEAVF